MLNEGQKPPISAKNSARSSSEATSKKTVPVLPKDLPELGTYKAMWERYSGFAQPQSERWSFSPISTEFVPHV
jgi:hypothetical protein